MTLCFFKESSLLTTTAFLVISYVALTGPFPLKAAQEEGSAAGPVVVKAAEAQDKAEEVPQDRERAVQLLRSDLEKGVAAAGFRLYAHYTSTEQWEQAVQALRQAVALNYSRAVYELAHCYNTGYPAQKRDEERAIQKNAKRADELHAQASKMGVRRATESFALMLQGPAKRAKGAARD